MKYLTLLIEEAYNKFSNQEVDLFTIEEGDLPKTTIALTGVPKAGKSLISGGLYNYLTDIKDKFFIERLAPDMEGQWTFESGKMDLARKLKNNLKERNEFFSPRFVKLKLMGIPGIVKNFNTSIFDHGGIPSQENKLFLRTEQKSANEYNSKFAPVILNNPQAPNSQGLKDWINFFEKQFNTTPLVFNPNWDFSKFSNDKERKKQAYEKAQELLNRIHKKF